MSFYTANTKLYENGSGAIGTTGTVLAFNSGDTVPDATVTANGLLTGGLVTLQPGAGAAVPQFPVTVIGTPTSGQIPAWNNSTHQWEPGASPPATYVAHAPGPSGSGDATALNAFIAANAGGRIAFSSTVGTPYNLDATLILYPNTTYDFGGSRFTWSGGNAPIVASKAWRDGGTVDDRIETWGGVFTGTGTGINQHGMVLRAVRPRLMFTQIDSPGGDGFRITTKDQTGTANTDSQVEPTLIGCQANDCVNGVPFNLGERGNSKITDGMTVALRGYTRSATGRIIAAPNIGVTNGSATITDASSSFTAADVGKYVGGDLGSAIQPATYIVSVESAGSATMSANAVATSSVDNAYVGGCQPILFVGGGAGWDIGSLHTYGGLIDATHSQVNDAVVIYGGYFTSLGTLYIEHFNRSAVYLDSCQETVSIVAINARSSHVVSPPTAAILYVNASNAAGGPNINVGSINVDHGTSGVTAYGVFDAGTSAGLISTISVARWAVTGTTPAVVQKVYTGSGHGSRVRFLDDFAVEAPSRTADASWLKPTGSLIETVSRVEAAPNLGTLTSGSLRLSAIPAPRGLTATSVSFLSGSTALVTGTHQWAVLLDSALKVLAVSPDDTSNAWAANAVKTFTFGTSYIIPSSGLYYVGLMVAAATVPTLHGYGQSSGVAMGLTPVLNGNSSSAQTVPPNIGDTMAAISGSSVQMYAYIS